MNCCGVVTFEIVICCGGELFGGSQLCDCVLSW